MLSSPVILHVSTQPDRLCTPHWCKDQWPQITVRLCAKIRCQFQQDSTQEIWNYKASIRISACGFPSNSQSSYCGYYCLPWIFGVKLAKPPHSLLHAMDLWGWSTCHPGAFYTMPAFKSAHISDWVRNSLPALQTRRIILCDHIIMQLGLNLGSLSTRLVLLITRPPRWPSFITAGLCLWCWCRQDPGFCVILPTCVWCVARQDTAAPFIAAYLLSLCRSDTAQHSC
jgi:hypothetical protein